MKQVYKVLTLAIVLSSLSLTMYAQGAFATDEVTATAVIIAPITVTNTTDFDFGWLAATPLGGTAVLSTLGVVTATGGVGVMPGGSANAATFNVTGAGANVYTISWPASVILNGSLTGTLTLNDFTAAATSGTLGTLASGVQTFTAGGTLTVPASTVPGTYTSDNFLVTVTYQ